MGDARAIELRMEEADRELLAWICGELHKIAAAADEETQGEMRGDAGAA